MYHIGIVEQVISPEGKGMISADASVQAVVRMWDDNLLIIAVDKKISKSVKKNDYVLTDYSPMSASSQHRKLCVTKILPQDAGSKVWTEFKDEFERRKASMQQNPPQQPVRYIR